MIDTLMFVGFCLSVFVIGFILVRGDDGPSTRRKGPWRPPEKRASDREGISGQDSKDRP